MFKTLLNNLGTTLGVFGISKFFWKHFKDSTLLGTLGKNVFQKNYPKYVQNTFEQFGNDFGRFWNFENFLKTFRRLDPPWNTGQKCFAKKLTQNLFKTRLDTFGNDFGHFWNFADFLNFWNHFEDSTLDGTLGKKSYQRNYPKTCSKHVWTNWERFWAFFEFWKFFKNISKTRPSLEQWAKNFSKKLPQNMFKTRLDKLGTFLGVFWILKIF